MRRRLCRTAASDGRSRREANPSSKRVTRRCSCSRRRRRSNAPAAPHPGSTCAAGRRPRQSGPRCARAIAAWRCRRSSGISARSRRNADARALANADLKKPLESLRRATTASGVLSAFADVDRALDALRAKREPEDRRRLARISGLGSTDERRSLTSVRQREVLPGRPHLFLSDPRTGTRLRRSLKLRRQGRR